MEAAVEAVFNDEVVAEAVDRFGLGPDVELIGDWENYVFKANRENKQVILRLSHVSHRTTSQIESELDWVHFMRSKDVAMAGPLPSAEGHLAEPVAEGLFVASAFEWAPGSLPEAEDWTPGLYQDLGAVIGKMHRVTLDYRPAPGIEPRESYLETKWRKLGLSGVPAEQVLVTRRWSEVFGAISELATSTPDYGLIHDDVHDENFHLDEGRIVVFDADDCTYAWFIEDLAVFFYHAEQRTRGDADPGDWAGTVVPAFLDGYSSEYAIGEESIRLFPLFLWARALTLYAFIHTKWDVENPDDDEAWYLEFSRRRIETGEGAWWDSVDFEDLFSKKTGN